MIFCLSLFYVILDVFTSTLNFNQVLLPHRDRDILPFGIVEHCLQAGSEMHVFIFKQRIHPLQSYF